MGKEKDYFTGKQEELKRSSVRLADYNPRRIGAEARAMLRHSIEKYGVVTGIVVNRHSMTVVGGNQKISILDEMMSFPDHDYIIRAEMVDIDNPAEEKALCVMLNSPNATGEWDLDKMRDIIPDLDCTDAGLTDTDISILGLDTIPDIIDEPRHIPQSKEEQAETRRMIEENQKVAYSAHEQQHGGSSLLDKSVPIPKKLEAESIVMLSFDSMDDRKTFLETFGFSDGDKMISGNKLMEHINNRS